MAIAVEAAAAGRQIIWGAPVFDQVRVGWDETYHAAGGIADFNHGSMTATFPGGGRIIYRSLNDPDNARSLTADGVVIDEAGDVAPAAWHEVLRPMLMDTGGWLWAIGTPKGLNWFFGEFNRALDREDSAAWNAPTLGATITPAGLVRAPHALENPHILFSEVQQLFETLPERVFRQEILAEFQSGEGAVFRNIRPNLTAPANPDPALHRAHYVTMGADWGRQHDFTVLSVFCATCAQELFLDRFNKVEWAFQRDRLRAAYGRWHVAKVLAEENSIGGPNIEALQKDGLRVVPFTTTAVSKPPLIQSLALAFERNEARWLNDPVATAELTAYEATVSKNTGRMSYGAPEGMHDDTVIARALAYRAAFTGSYVGSF